MTKTRRILVVAALAFMVGESSSRGANTAELKPAVPRDEVYSVPQGGVAELIEFVEKLLAIQPATVADDSEYRAKFHLALRKAGERLLDLDKDPKSDAHRIGTFILLADRSSRVAQLESPEQDKVVADIKAYLVQEPLSGADLAMKTAKTLQKMGAWEQAADAYRQFADAPGDRKDSKSAKTKLTMTAAAKRLSGLNSQITKAVKPAVAPLGNLLPIDLQVQGNRMLSDGTGSALPGNGLAEMALGQQKFGGASFWIGEKVLQLGSTWAPNDPKTIEVPVQRRASRIYLLHGTFKGFSEAASQRPMNVKDGTRIGEYRIAYEDDSTVSIPIIYGEDVRDHWTSDGGMPVKRGKVVWTGSNIATRGRDVLVRVYLGVWENPHPEKKLAQIQYVSTMETECAPFCVAITLEEPVPANQGRVASSLPPAASAAAPIAKEKPSAPPPAKGPTIAPASPTSAGVAAKGDSGKPKASLDGVWTGVNVQIDGEPIPLNEYQPLRVVFTKNKFTLRMRGKTIFDSDYVVDAGKTPSTIDIGGEKRTLGIYRLEGDKLTIAIGESEEKRPEKFTYGSTTSPRMLIELQRGELALRRIFGQILEK